MSKKDTKSLNADRELGTIKKKLPSGMWETDKKEKVPPFPGVNVGDKVKLVRGRFEIDMKTLAKFETPVDPKDAKIAELEKKIAALEGRVGEQGSKIASIGGNAAQQKAKTPPKAE